MPPTEDQLDRDYDDILRATLAACHAMSFKVQYCEVPVIVGKWGSTSFSKGASSESKLSAETFLVQERITTWIDYLIAEGVLSVGATVCIHVCKDLMDGGVDNGLPGVTVIMWAVL
jgi:hypothetical protein